MGGSCQPAAPPVGLIGPAEPAMMLCLPCGRIVPATACLTVHLKVRDQTQCVKHLGVVIVFNSIDHCK